MNEKAAALNSSFILAAFILPVEVSRAPRALSTNEGFRAGALAMQAVELDSLSRASLSSPLVST
jgi:hypothetical protein